MKLKSKALMGILTFSPQSKELIVAYDLSEVDKGIEKLKQRARIIDNRFSSNKLKCSYREVLVS